jgi:branched-chain amino acid transport system substrate-binding protein
MRFTRFGALAIAAAMAVGACSQTAAPSTSPGASGATGGKTLKLGVTLPLSGGAAADGQPTLKGAQLAVKQANDAGGIAGYTIELVPLDHAVNGKYNEQQGAADMQTFASDPAVIGVIGPYNSAVAKAQIPISNDAGLLQCSPANTNEGLTKPEFGALDLRKNFPERINYIRVATTDDVQGPAMASYAYNDLELRNILVIDDVTTFGTGVADNFEAKFKELGGEIADRVGAPADTTDFNGIITEAQGQDPDAVYYGGVVTSGGGLLLKQMRQQGMDVPFLGPDGIVNGSGEAEGSLIQIAGAEAADNSFGTIAAIGDFPAKAEFDQQFEEAFANDADFKTPGAYSGPAHACATVVLESLRGFLEGNANADQAAIREGVRAFATDSANTFDTVLGETSFDENGDNTAKFISFYEVDPNAPKGGDWIFIEQQDFGGEG